MRGHDRRSDSFALEMVDTLLLGGLIDSRCSVSHGNTGHLCI